MMAIGARREPRQSRSAGASNSKPVSRGAGTFPRGFRHDGKPGEGHALEYYMHHHFLTKIIQTNNSKISY